MESPKFPHEHRAWSAAVVRRIAEQYPESHIREDAEHFIYDVVDADGKHAEVHTPKWDKIPVKEGDDTVRSVRVEDVIEAELRFRGAYTEAEYSLAKILHRAGKL